MSESETREIGAISWIDLTVENAEQVGDFYHEVVGWEAAELEMEGYSDYCMNSPASGKTIAGICNARGVNADLPSVWLVYIIVENLDKSAARCVELGGKVLVAPKNIGDHGRYCVIQDPAGAVAALFEPSS